MTEVSPPQQPHPGPGSAAAPPLAAPPAAEAQRPIWRRPRVLIAAAAIAVVGLVATVVLLLAGGSADVKVSFSLHDFAGTSDCEGGTGGYGDIGPGTDVVVRGGDGQVLGTAQLGDGPSVPMSEVLEEEVLDGGCIWSTTVRDVPTGEDFYSVSVGERGEQTYSEEELEEREWDVSLELGGA